MDALVFEFQKNRESKKLIDINLFAQRIASLRRTADLTQKDLARLCGVRSQAVSKWERGVSHS